MIEQYVDAFRHCFATHMLEAGVDLLAFARGILQEFSAAELPEHYVLIARNMGPAELLDYERKGLRGLVLEEGSPGAHVVVPLSRGAEVPQETLLDAAHLALHHARGAGADRGEVSYTRAKFVRRVKGAPPGAVSYSGEKTFLVRLEPARLERLLASREEP